MKLSNIHIHNFRSIIDESFDLEKYSLLIGENNSGKTNVINALRCFYEDDGMKFKEKDDFPKRKATDNDSWVELEFLTTDDEQSNLKDEYKTSDNLLKVRKYFKSTVNKDLVKAGQSNIYGYESGNLSTNLFYGAKNISNAKLGKVLYIPETYKTDDNLKMSGPSPLRNMVNFVMGKVVDKSPTYASLKEAFENFNKEFPAEKTAEGFSLENLQRDINRNVEEWGIKFGLHINPISTENIVKNLVSHYIEDTALDNQHVDINLFGQGLQRHLIYTLLRVGATYTEKKKVKKKEFSPDFTLILFEEPEAFLHPTQQEILNISLQKIADEDSQQIIITTHSPIFVRKNIDLLPSLLKLRRQDGVSKIYQVNHTETGQLFDENNSLFKLFSDLLADDAVSSEIKNKIKSKNLGDKEADVDQKLQEESLKYFLWMDGERSCVFFAKHVFICEGASEKVFFDYLFDNEWHELKPKHIYFLDAMGKFNLHRYMNLFNQLGISHSVIYDKDPDSEVQSYVNDFIEDKKNGLTQGIHAFNIDLEDFLGIDRSKRKDLKPLNVIYKYRNGEIDADRINNLRGIIESLLPSD